MRAASEDKGSTHIEVEREADDGEEPEGLVEPTDVSAEPVLVLLRERHKQEVEEIYRREREQVCQQGFEHVRAHLGVAVYQ